MARAKKSKSNPTGRAIFKRECDGCGGNIDSEGVYYGWGHKDLHRKTDCDVCGFNYLKHACDKAGVPHPYHGLTKG